MLINVSWQNLSCIPLYYLLFVLYFSSTCQLLSLRKSHHRPPWQLLNSNKKYLSGEPSNIVSSSYLEHRSSIECPGRGVCQRQGNFIANDRTWTRCRVSPKILSGSGKRASAARCCAHGARRGLMTAASIIWSFWANSQITGAGRDYCYYTRPRTQSKPDYTSVSLSLPILTRSFDCQLFALVHLHSSPPRDGRLLSLSLHLSLSHSTSRAILRTIL